MKFTVDRDILANSVSWTSHTLQSKSTSPVRMGVLLNAKNETLTLQAVGDDSSSKSVIEAKVDEEGTILVSGKLLADICKALPNKPVHVSLEDKKVLIKCGSSRFTLITMNIDEYPEINQMPQTFGTVDSQEFYNVINQIKIAASKDDMIPVLSSIKMDFIGKKIYLTATDRFRLAKGELDWTPEDENINVSVLIKSKNLYDIARSLNHGGTISLGLNSTENSTLIGFECVGYQVTSSLREGDYPKVDGIFPQETPITALVETKELIESIKRVGLVLNPNEPIRFNFDEEGLTLEAGKGNDSQATESLSANLNGEDIVVAFNQTFLIEGLSVLETKYVKFFFNHPTKAILLKGWDDKNNDVVEEFKYLLMPVRV
ncbi:DNA polymerase III subunit beta [Actinomyces sp. zg-332]|uniref:DNA polymerase III subunit beta n=1 Tax=Actinomyces sp. zg-332 TaxID=2708340 RepID=UPI001421EF56|nr:DNA polymerase III subunit beta [Actinomyces sp. zg-332]QPK94148.1 DNA polymerase III subunit beta [Actinomyces sp. zg-332]